MPVPKLREIFIVHASFTLLLGVLLYSLMASLDAMSYVAGATLMGANLIALYWAWQRIFLKKSIALSLSVIVSKYAILGLLMYILIASQRVDVLSFLLGTVVLMPSLLFLMIKHKRSLANR